MTGLFRETVSAVVAVHNGERFLAETLDSIFSQTRPPDEVIVVDDGSTDGTADVVGRFSRARLVPQAKAGQAAALNLGIAESAGTLLAFLDADNLWPLDKTERQLAALRRNPKLELVYGQARQFVDPSVKDRFELPMGREVLPAKVPGAGLLRRSAFDRLGPFREDLPTGSAIEWYTRARDAMLVELVLDEIVLLRRIHAGNVGKAFADPQGYFSAIRATLARRRRNGAA